jgi:hypothetical protein
MSDHFRVLFVGNSYTTRNDMPMMLKQLATASDPGVRLEIEVVAFGGASLAAHWNKGDVQNYLGGQKWDAVVLQDQSTRPLRALTSMQKHVRLLVAAAKTSGAKPFLYMTWARKHDPASQRAITEAYQQLAEETGAALVPVGLVWQELRKIGHGLELYAPDESHPSAIGSYIAACTHLVSLFGAAPKAGTHTDGLLAEKDLDLVHQLCWKIASQDITSHSTPTTTLAAG